MNVERLYEYWDELYNQYGSALHDVLSEQTLIDLVQEADRMAPGSTDEMIWKAVFPALLAAEDELSAETLDLMEGCYGRE